MKSVGEAMAIGRTFKESLQKCLRSLEIGRSGLGGDGKPWRISTEVYGDRDILPRDVISRKLSVPNRIAVGRAELLLRLGWSAAVATPSRRCLRTATNKPTPQNIFNLLRPIHVLRLVLPADPNYGVLHPLNNIPIALESVPETKIYAPT